MQRPRRLLPLKRPSDNGKRRKRRNVGRRLQRRKRQNDNAKRRNMLNDKRWLQPPKRRSDNAERRKRQNVGGKRRKLNGIGGKWKGSSKPKREEKQKKKRRREERPRRSGSDFTRNEKNVKWWNESNKRPSDVNWRTWWSSCGEILGPSVPDWQRMRSCSRTTRTASRS